MLNLQGLTRIAGLFKLMYSNDTLTSSGLYMLPVASKLTAKCLLLYQSYTTSQNVNTVTESSVCSSVATVYISVVYEIIKAISVHTTDWISQIMDTIEPTVPTVPTVVESVPTVPTVVDTVPTVPAVVETVLTVEKCTRFAQLVIGLLCNTNEVVDVVNIIDCYIIVLYSGLLSHKLTLEILINTAQVSKIYIITN